MSLLKISLVSSITQNQYDERLKLVFDELLDLLKKQDNPPQFMGIEFLKFSYNDEPYIISKNTIASLTPANYLRCQEKLGDRINAILAVKKVHQKLPYFPAFFIANKDSAINSIRSEKIKRIFVVTAGSTSGYIAPLYKLWESKIIEEPNRESIEKIGWEMIPVGTQKDVEEEILKDKEAIGATGQFCNQDDPDNCLVKPILRYYNFPQDVIVISNNLLSYKKIIASWFQDIFQQNSDGKLVDDKAAIFFDSSTKITGVSKIDTEFENALADLKNMIDRVAISSAADQMPFPGTNGNGNCDRNAGKKSNKKHNKVFISYSHDDAEYRKELQQYLVNLEREGTIEIWQDGIIKAGEDWDKKIREGLEKADVCIMLLSQSFIVSNYVHETEYKRIMEKQAKGTTRIIPVLLKECDWKNWNVYPENVVEKINNDNTSIFKIGTFQFLPVTKEKRLYPVNKWRHREDAWLQVSKAVQELCGQGGE
jgi:hypothetical protein